MKQPETTQIGPMTYKVTFHPESIYSEDHQELLGDSREYEQEIRLAAGCHPERLRLVALHEVIHAVSDVHGADMKERQVERLATGMYDWLRRNREFLAWMLDEEAQ